ncbi:acetyl-CoA carboxylase biotin carboxyl carrier protein [Pectinatus haikarae]|uniref:Biotin carboxyl carrier protein of acetyl-CoA carboxylase n=1 Tax=Pectinatus haikarae TaxID=349096 RepID=A0ABT9YAC1_9FIRM|nr:acetyl-CoA carboxylase biotin carboxyl carrier protein [Pectinatus haikarae]MDQ0204671.1 acetyl-CoA carboxylase biotin carboxyl carrier protein [Pectinatus haikarae]
MFELDEIKDLMHALEHSSLNRLKVKFSDGEILLEKNSVPSDFAPVKKDDVTAPAIAVNKESDKIEEITAPMVGTFYSSPEPNMPSFVQPGSKVHPNTVICILEAMKLFSEIEAQAEGEIVEVLVKDGDFVEYGQPLFKIKTY